MTAYLSGFALGLSLILAIGAQNAFVLKQGLKRQHVFLVCSLCAISDAILITFGVMGFGALVEQYPWVAQIARYGGAAFLAVYAAMSFYSAYSQNHSLVPSDSAPESALKIALICLGFTWLNPHVYLDTVIFLGSISTQFSADIEAFTLGAVSASFVFFYSLGYGARILIPVFEQPRAWQILEFFIGLLMLILAASLIFT
ncbi:MAG: LysE/ArgO family amino acid transporter [Porticoccaceae bacterium]|nr:LysE/ArgO family amino acid transporter [Porticoccaceae bacterium]